MLSGAPEVCEVNLQWQNEQKEKNDFLPSISASFADEKAIRMMQKMGYKTGTGLGKNEQGIKEAVEVAVQLGKRGFGLNLKNLNLSKEDWDFLKEEITIEEKVQWLESIEKPCKFTPEILDKWAKEGPPNHDIENECNFCDKDILTKVFRAKDIFDELNILELCQARAKANLFETIRSVFFMNRAALKMANIEAATDFMFTNIDENSYFSKSKGPFYFADVCAGPGGFTEYILWRKKWFFKGFGLTLKDKHDFTVGDSQCASPVTFQAIYGEKGDGDVCRPENILDFSERVRNETDGEGVHFMMSDGGFSVEGKENIQEILSKNIYICQCLLALEIVRTHGHFVTKIFDIFTPFSVGLLYLMYLCFHKVGILKPNSSRPANSERYFVCCNLREAAKIKHIKQYLWKTVKRLWEIRKNADIDVLELVPLEIIKNDAEFYSYVVESNNRLGKKQIIGLEKLAAFCRNPSLIEVRQEDMRKRCLEYWRIPDQPKVPLPQFKLDNLLSHINLAPEIFLVQSREINKMDILDLTVNDIEDWHYAPMFSSRTTNRCNFYAGIGRSKVYRLQGNKWVKVKDIHLVKGTLLYGEFVKETIVISSGNQLCQKYSLHVIDALRLGDKNLSNLDFNKRREFIKVYCKSVNKESQSQYSVRIRLKSVEKLKNISSKAEEIIKDEQTGQNYSNLPIVGYGACSESFDVNSILLLKTNKNQSFHSTYVLRAQIYLNLDEGDNDTTVSLENLSKYISQKL